MSKTIVGNFAANGDSVTFKAKRFVVHLGTDSAENFGGGTVELKSKGSSQVDWTTDSTTYTATDIIQKQGDMLGSLFKLTLTGATSPDIDYTITY